MTTNTRAFGRMLGAAAVLASVGCTDFLTVENPNVVDVSALDPVKDATTLAMSAQQNFAVAQGWSVMYSSWFNGESIVAETFPTRNEFGRRDTNESNGSLASDVWAPISLAAASSKIVLDLSLARWENLVYAVLNATLAGFARWLEARIVPVFERVNPQAIAAARAAR